MTLLKANLPRFALLLNNLQIWFLYTGLVYKLGCEAAMKVRDVDHLEGAHLL